jgi:diguanylate cyclase (GGDEF)-like protein
MVSVIRRWIVDQLMFGEFASYRDVCRKSIWVALKVSVLAYGLNLCAHFLLYGFDLLPYRLGLALIIATVLTPPITFAVSVTAYIAVGFAIHELGVSRAEFEKLSRTDMLSGLANRRAFLDRFDQCDRDKAMLVIDLDRFKSVNDTYGHTAGDEVIVKVSQMLAEVFSDRCLCARIGGEEFAVFCWDMPFAEFAALGEIARRRVASMRIEAKDGGFSVTVSAGLARALPQEQFGDVFSRADKALYAAKAGGRDRIVLCYETGGGAFKGTSKHKAA